MQKTPQFGNVYESTSDMWQKELGKANPESQKVWQHHIPCHAAHITMWRHVRKHEGLHPRPTS